MVSIESRPVSAGDRHKKHNTKKEVKFLKLKAVDYLKKETIKKAVDGILEKGTKTVPGGSTSHVELDEYYNLDSKVVEKKEINTMLPWAHKAISNAKRLLLDVHHRIDGDFLQNHLDEFCHKFNRGHFENQFDRLMTASVSYSGIGLGNLTDKHIK